MRFLAVLAGLLVLAPGCLGTLEDAETPGAAAPSAATPPVVVAVIDSGINPYHLAFRGGPSFDDVPGFAAISRPLAVTLDVEDYGAAVAEDDALWESVQQGEIVRFPGTRLAAYSLSKELKGSQLTDERATSPVHALDFDGHGTVVSHAVLDAAPHAVVVVVQVDDDETIADAMRWIATQPWIDLVTVSWATWATEHAEGETRMGLPEAYAEAARAGKLIFNGAGNEPTPHFAGEHSGPPFVIAVGGAHNATRGDMALAARFPDVIAAFSQIRARHDSTADTAWSSGTSLSSPYAAGVAAEALWLARDGARALAAPGGAFADGAVTADELRDAMNRAALVWAPTEWAPGITDDGTWPLSAPVIAAAAQMGWGYVAPEIAPAMAAHLLAAAPLPDKDAATVAYMQARHEARAAAWGEA